MYHYFVRSTQSVKQHVLFNVGTLAPRGDRSTAIARVSKVFIVKRVILYCVCI